MESSSLREDLLEALFAIHQAGSPARIGDLARLLGKEPGGLGQALADLEAEGDLVTCPDGSFLLTPSGIGKGGRVMRKHRILASFFSEILGMPTETASLEACTLEHGVSDEAIERLGRYLRTAEACRSRGGQEKPPCRGRCLSEAAEGEDLTVCCTSSDGPDPRLGDLGILPGGQIRIVRRIPGNGVVIRVKGCDIALSSEIAGSIMVERTG